MGPELERALEAAARGEWQRAHELVQDQVGPEAAWIHAHLHREEGDLANARYWYARAGREVSQLEIEAERAQIARALTPTRRRS